MIRDTPDDRLRRLYDLALSRRGGNRFDLPVETIHALATSTYTGADRIPLLDRVLGDPALAAEFDFFAEVGRESPGSARVPARSFPPAFSLAASVALFIGAGVLWRATRPAPDVPRGPTDALVVASPLAGGTIESGSPFVWLSLPGATIYRIRVIDGNGAEVFSRETADTAVTIPAEVSLEPGSTYSWWVVASLPDGRTLRSNAVSVSAAVR